MIQSRQNKWIRRVRRALDRHDEEIVIEGPKMISDATRLGWKPLVVLEDQARVTRRDDSLSVESRLFSEISSTTTSQGVLALFPRPDSTVDDLLEFAPRRLVALDGVQDPGNVGTIIRLCAAFGACGIVRLPGTADPWGDKAIRASAGAVLAVPVIESTIDGLIEFAREEDLSIFAASTDSTNTTIPPDSDVLIVLGSEGRGPSEQWHRVGHGIRIPMSDRVDSLNVAAAGAILLSRLYDGR
ncbi:MAG: RNA methyltransferase [Thermoanaerobaculia bacterium]|nr:RNA methyltransferase [Thermoanaerobaculia bacterium]